MNAKTIAQQLELAIPDSQVLFDLTKALAEDQVDANYVLAFPDQVMVVPIDTPMYILYRTFQQDYRKLSSAGYRVGVAIGETNEASGIIKARYCFVTILYDKEGHLITFDFYQDLLPVMGKVKKTGENKHFYFYEKHYRKD